MKSYLKKSKNKKALIIDLRGNGGGNSDYTNAYLYPMLMGKKDFKDSHEYILYRNNEVFKFDPQYPDLKASIKKIKEADFKYMEENIPYLNNDKEMMAEIRKNFTHIIFNPANKNAREFGDEYKFNGNLYLLVDRDVYSSAQIAAHVFRDNNFGVVIGALDAYVTAVLMHDTSAALENLDVIFDSGKNMARFVTDLLQYLRDLLIVKTGGENTHISEIFLGNLNTPQERLFELIEIATKSLSEIKNSLQPKIYTEMMTIRLAEGQEKAELPSNLVSEIETLKDEISQLKGQLASLQPSSAPSNTVQGTQSAKTSKGYRVDRHKVNAILQEAVENPSLARSNLTKLQNAWGEIIESLAGADKALLVGSQPVAANENHAILAFESSFNAEQTMNR